MCFPFMLPWEDPWIRHMWSGFGKFSPRGGNTWLCCVIWQFLSLWFYEQMENVALDSSLCFKLLPFSAIHVFSPASHLLSVCFLLLLSDTWLRQTWRTPPFGWGRASAPQCLPCWASPCTERFSNSGDQTEPDFPSLVLLLTLPLLLPPLIPGERKDSQRRPDPPARPHFLVTMNKRADL